MTRTDHMTKKTGLNFTFCILMFTDVLMVNDMAETCPPLLKRRCN
jgi:hypothetical protein